MNKLKCYKIYTDIPFGHRQHLHDGHCAFLHGHNWSFEFCFEAQTLDSNGFVIDFGKLKYLKNFIETVFDHAMVLSEDDPLKDLVPDGLCKKVLIKNCSCEGIAEFLYEKSNLLVNKNENGRVKVSSVKVIEDSKNFVIYEG